MFSDQMPQAMATGNSNMDYGMTEVIEWDFWIIFYFFFLCACFVLNEKISSAKRGIGIAVDFQLFYFSLLISLTHALTHLHRKLRGRLMSISFRIFLPTANTPLLGGDGVQL